MSRRTRFGTVAVALVLCGCAGGGGGSPATNTVTPNTSTSTPVPPVAGADAFRTAEYLQMGGLDQIRAADAYALGYTGRGVIIGIVDFNFDFNNSEVSFDPASIGPNPQAVTLYQAQTGTTVNSDQHGFAVAATAAARKNNVGGQGVAFDATVLAVDYFSDVNETQTVQSGVRYHVSDPWTYMTSRGVRIINTSFGYESGDVLANPPQVSEAYVLASPATAVVNGALLVSSAGNAGGVNPSLSNFDILSDMQSFGVLTSGPGAFIIVGAVDANNQIASFSDRAGTLKDHYMVAPGTNLLLPWNGGMAFVSGTSFAAPMVSGGAALIFQRWPNLTALQVANILFSTATDLGAPGVDAIYGHGLLNLAAALQPVGVTTFAVAGTNVAPTVNASGIVLASAFGDAPAIHRALSSIMILDSFGRDFQMNLSASAGSRPNLPDLFSVLEQRLGWHSTDFLVGQATGFSFDVRRRPEDGIVPFQPLAGPQDYSTHETVMRLSGVADGIGWTAGTGLSLHDSMSPAGDNVFAYSLTNAFSPMVGAAPGAVASVSVPVAQDTDLSFGTSLAENQGLTDHLRTPYRNSAETASLRLDHSEGNAHFSLEIGDTLETGGLMGSLAAGGLKMAERASTTWTTASAQAEIAAHWSLKGAFTFAASSSAHPQASLITAIGPVYATSFALGLAGEDIFRKDDTLSFTLGQPLRAERGSLMLMSGVGRDWSTGGVIMGETDASLVPSGREFDFETGYLFALAGWGVGANVAYALDSNHVQDKNAVLALFTLQRTF
ncbi:MAG TPA: S8 family peptidase [Micropepsaceae bacterium]|nr:S8 family peptidase [Micropepsaceae bacterium]